MRRTRRLATADRPDTAPRRHAADRPPAAPCSQRRRRPPTAARSALPQRAGRGRGRRGVGRVSGRSAAHGSGRGRVDPLRSGRCTRLPPPKQLRAATPTGRFAAPCRQLRRLGDGIRRSLLASLLTGQAPPLRLRRCFIGPGHTSDPKCRPHVRPQVPATRPTPSAGHTSDPKCRPHVRPQVPGQPFLPSPSEAPPPRRRRRRRRPYSTRPLACPPLAGRE